MTFEMKNNEHEAHCDEALENQVEVKDEREIHGGLTREELRAIVVEMIG
ncbi:MAG: hypothetical protein JWL93_2346 [Hyphomicrobiales bacterium]|jgi:hypothetical protein|nr:hypothetical protein [Hyphomicrobiales bacterium]